MNEYRDIWWPSPAQEHANVLPLTLPRPFETDYGCCLERIQVAYESWGRLNADADNVILIVHPLASDPHAAGIHFGQEDGWWDALIGPGLALDTDRFFVVCPNLLGGCYGTTGPRFPCGDEGSEPLLGEFPLLTPRDLQRVQQMFVQQLGVKRLHRVIGPSMGAMVAWEWAVAAGDYVEQVVAIAAPLQTTPYQIGLNWLQRRGIDLDLAGGDPLAKSGQMLARGVGMLSYRSPVGLEDKFGRDWFQRPQGTLAKRGVYNIESWLRHHGKRIVKRFDPYTYLLFSRAMDLHDVGENRGGVEAALGQVQCDVVAVGISSDQLYPAAEVRRGVDILHHLGKSARYAEVRSPHGHDAFLLETKQLAEILSLSAGTGTAGVPAIGTRTAGGPAAGTPTEMSPGLPEEVRTVRLGLLGAGPVATRLLELLATERDRLGHEHGLRFESVVVEPSTRVGSPALGGPADIDVVLDLTRGADSHPVVETVLRQGISVVTSNKALVREHGESLERLARENGARLASHNSVAAGWPLLHSMERPLGREPIRSIHALLSTASNGLFELIEEGRGLEESVAWLQGDGAVGPDPESDLSGWDSVQKLILLIAHARRVYYASADIPVHGFRSVDPELVRAAPFLGFRIRQVAMMEYLEGPETRMVAAVRPCAVSMRSHLGANSARDHVLVLEGEQTGEMVFLGRAAGETPLASAVLSDLIGLCNPDHSGIGPPPPAESEVRAPQFTQYLALVDGQGTLVDEFVAGAVPVLSSLPAHGPRRS